MRNFIVGVMGAGEDASREELQMAFRLGELIARQGWVLLTGGRNAGVMHAASRGAKSIAGSLTIGILPDRKSEISKYVDVAIITDIGQARNNINVLSSDVVVACGARGAGTISEIALAIKNHKPVIVMNADAVSRKFFERLNYRELFFVSEADEALKLICKKLVKSKPRKRIAN
ncbi:MAG: TIGR00725 family protein [Acidobacteriota bacterium]